MFVSNSNGQFTSMDVQSFVFTSYFVCEYYFWALFLIVGGFESKQITFHGNEKNNVIF